MRRLVILLVPALLAPALLAGCASEEAAESTSEPVTNSTAPEFVEDYDLGNVTIPKEDLQNATLGAEHIHDLWGDFQQLVLLDEEVQAGLCEGPIDAAFYAMLRVFQAQEGAYGCARLSLPEGIVVPEGTAELLFEIDASAALKSGAMALQWRNKAREEETPPSTTPVTTWTIPLAAPDWDIPHATATTFVMYITARGPVGVLEGPLKAKITAIKIENWQPILAVAHVDHWKLPALHDVPAPGVMRILDTEASVQNIDVTRFGSGWRQQPIPFTDIIAPGTKVLTLVVDRTATDCAPILDCWLVPLLQMGGYQRFRFGEMIYAEGERRVYAWSVPDEVSEDSVYANESTAQVFPRIDACVKGAEEQTCGFTSILSNKASARILALIWKEDVDIEVLKSIADAPAAAGES